MDYPGNSSLSPDVRERVLNTYRQTLGLAGQGNRQEASLGCDFILRLDPEFEPARTLMTRLEEGDGPVHVDDLQPGGPAFSVSPPRDDGMFDRLEHLDLDLGDGGAETTDELEPLRAELRRLVERRQNAEAIQRAQEAGDAATADPQIQKLLRTARSRQEAEPYLQSFLDSARTELRAGNAEQAGRHLQSAKELDPSHPEVLQLEPLISSGGGGGAGQAPLPGTGGGATAVQSELDQLGSIDLSPGGDDAGAASGDDGRIRDLLNEGQTAFEAKDYQGAIDAWSRIFLIDIDHQEAARRIERARRLKAEHERKLEEVFHEGVNAFEEGNAEKAQELLQQVLQIQPNHLAAKEYLQRIEAGETPTSPPAAPVEEQPPPTASEAPVASRAPTGTPVPSLPDLEDEDYEDDVLIPPDVTRAAAAATFPQPASSRSSRTLLVVGALVLVAVGGGAWMVLQQWDSWFPNANEPAVATQDPIRSASAFHNLGQTEVAIAQLKQILPGEPYYEEAQALISQWEAEVGAKREATPEGSGDGAVDTEPATAADPQVASAKSSLIGQARRAIQRNRYFRAETLLLEAERIAGGLDSAETGLLTQVRQELDPLRSQVAMVRSGEWEYALPELWRMREEDPANIDINELLTLSYYNLGVRDLQRGDATNAVSQFEEAASLMEGPDPELERHLSFARSYQGRSKDLLYQIYVKYLPTRR